MRIAPGLLCLLLLLAGVAAAERPQPPESFAPVVDAVKPAVLSVVIPPEPDADDPEDDVLAPGDIVRKFFDALLTLPNRTLGAALVVDPSGVAVTGLRLLRGLAQVEVIDIDGRRSGATVIGRDDRTDIAILRLDGAGPFRAVPLGDSDSLRVGDWIVTLGSPYGFEASVSAGIVSARARLGPGGSYGDMLQTDAAVNPGSAGGPLVNVRGDVVGIAAIAAPRGSGIAFAVPSNIVRTVVADLLAHGRVVRSWLGVEPQPLSAGLARGFRAPFAGGLIVADVVGGSPAARAGLARGAILTALDGHPLRTVADLETALSARPPGRAIVLHAWRDGRESTVRVVLGQEPRSTTAVERVHPVLGLMVEGITPEVGVVVVGVMPGSPAAGGGVLRGDVVREIDRRTIRTLTDFDEAAPPSGRDATVMMLVQRGRTSLYLALTVER